MDASFHIRPFGFDTIFSATQVSADSLDDLDPWLRIEALRAELAKAQVEGEARIVAARAEGFMAGQTQARDDQAAALLAATDAIHSAIDEVDAALEVIAARTVRDAAEVAQASAEILAGRAFEMAPAAAIDEAIGRALKQVARGQAIQVAVHPDLLQQIEAIIAERQAGDRRRLSLTAIGDAAVAPGDAHIQWDQGGIVLDAAVRAALIRTTLADFLPVS